VCFAPRDTTYAGIEGELMRDKNEVAAVIRAAFATTPYPGDAFLVGSSEGCEPEDEAGAFRGRVDRDALDAAFLDGHYCALSFFSEGGFRYYLPAYLLADLDERLMTADPVFHLTGGFADATSRVEVGGRAFTRPLGRTALVNPRRFGAMTSYDYARFRLSVFAREEAAAILMYLEYKRALDPAGFENAAIDAALGLFWRERASSAPTAADLAAHVAQDQALLDATSGPARSR
jgi:hypothetical protein